MADLGLDASPLPVEIIDDSTGNELTINADGSINVVPGSINVSRVQKTGRITTSATTADQVVLTYTVTASKTFFLEYLELNAFEATIPGNANPIDLGSISLEVVAGTKVITDELFHPPNKCWAISFSTDMPIAAGTVVRVVVTPALLTNTVWIANFGGIEK